MGYKTAVGLPQLKGQSLFTGMQSLWKIEI